MTLYTRSPLRHLLAFRLEKVAEGWTGYDISDGRRASNETGGSNFFQPSTLEPLSRLPAPSPYGRGPAKTRSRSAPRMPATRMAAFVGLLPGGEGGAHAPDEGLSEHIASPCRSVEAVADLDFVRVCLLARLRQNLALFAARRNELWMRISGRSERRLFDDPSLGTHCLEFSVPGTAA
jgi:hypothetical protein